MAASGSHSTLALPELLAGRYRALGALGRGAIAEVVRARDQETGDDVALKILYPHLRESAIVVERFRREVEIVRRIAHPNVLRIHDVIESDGRLFLVMDFHPGGDLADRLAQRRRLNAGEIVHLARHLCGALEAAHRAGVVHRDVKPSNVLVGGGTELDVRLCDFGLARTVEHAGLTVANAVLGTPEYMAPEVVTEGQADPRSDIYSLGVVLFEAATGRLPFYSDSPYQLMRQHIDVEAPRARSLAPDLPAAIDEAIARALAKDPLDRFATADDLARALTDESPALVTTTAAPATKRRTCPACGGWRIELAATCADCGTRTLQLEWQRGGVDVLVDGPGKVADKLDAWRHAALFRLLDLIAPPMSPTTTRRPAPRLPFYVARGLTTTSAEGLVEILTKGALLEARIVWPSLFGPKKMRSKAANLAARYGAVLGATTAANGINTLDFLPHAARLAFILAPMGILFVLFSIALIRGKRPLVRRTTRPSLSAATDDLARLISTLQIRQDRRLVARVLDRLAELAASDQGDVAELLAQRAALAARGLAAIDERRAAAPPGAEQAGRALEELRRDEQARVFLRNDLLRSASRLDGAHLIVARAAAVGSSEETARLGQQIQALTSELEAEEDLQEWLRQPR